jgi:hypothetical protein
MNEICRFRPSNDFTFDELSNNYLWFSCPAGFKDKYDSNVDAFIEQNKSIKDLFERIFKNYQQIGEIAKNIGICCFTTSLPPLDKWKCFPLGNLGGIFIEFNKSKIENHFSNEYGLGNCFKKIEYLNNPVIFKSYSENDIIWKKTNNGSCLYKALSNIEKDPKLMDELFLKMFTRINCNFYFSHKTIGNNGYKIQIPRESIQKIYLSPKNSKYPPKNKTTKTKFEKFG